MSPPKTTRAPERRAAPPTPPALSEPIIVVARELEAVARWTDPILPRLQPVAFRDDEYIALDGHRMVRVPCLTHGRTFGLDPKHIFDTVAAVCHLRIGKEVTMRMYPSDKQVEIHIGDEPEPHRVRIQIPMRDVSAFPTQATIDRLAAAPPAPDQTIAGHWFNTKYLAAIDEIHSISSGSAPRGVEIVSHSPDRLGAVLFRNNRGIRFYVMPVKADTP